MFTDQGQQIKMRRSNLNIRIYGKTINLSKYQTITNREREREGERERERETNRINILLYCSLPPSCRILSGIGGGVDNSVISGSLSPCTHTPITAGDCAWKKEEFRLFRIRANLSKSSPFFQRFRVSKITLTTPSATSSGLTTISRIRSRSPCKCQRWIRSPGRSSSRRWVATTSSTRPPHASAPVQRRESERKGDSFKIWPNCEKRRWPFSNLMKIYSNNK